MSERPATRAEPLLARGRELCRAWEALCHEQFRAFLARDLETVTLTAAAQQRLADQFSALRRDWERAQDHVPGADSGGGGAAGLENDLQRRRAAFVEAALGARGANYRNGRALLVLTALAQSLLARADAIYDQRGTRESSDMLLAGKLDWAG